MYQQEIKRSLSVLYTPGEVFEVRMLPRGKDPVYSGYFNDVDKAAEICFKMNGVPEGIYTTINPCKPELLARVANRIEPQKNAKGNSTTEPDILKRKWLMFDIDAVRPSGISASDQEHELAIKTAYELEGKLINEMCFPEAVIGDSGNGAHLEYRIDLPNNDESKKLIEMVFKVIREKYNNIPGIDIQTFQDANRIWKLKGTKVCKGDNIPERPHRQSKILKVPEKIEVISTDFLQSIYVQKEPEKNTSPPKNNGKAWDADKLKRWLESHGAVIERTKVDGKTTRYVLETCLMTSDHTGHKEAEVHISSDGIIGYKCHHNSCSDVTWKMVRAKYEPEAYTNLPKREKFPTSSDIPSVYRDVFVYNEKDEIKGVSKSAIVDNILSDVRCLTLTDTREILMYHDGVYHTNGSPEFEKQVHEWATDAWFNITLKNECINLLSVKTFEDRKSLNLNKSFLNVLNGLYDLQKNILSNHDPDVLSTIQLPVNFQPEADCPKFKKYLSEVVYPEDIPLLQEFMGYCLYPFTLFHKAFMLYGTGGNGKGVFLHVLNAMLGLENTCALSLQELEERPFSLSQLYGKLANICGDLSPNALRGTGNFKKLTGGDIIDAEVKFSNNHIRFENTAKMIFSANQPPRTLDDTDAFWQRWELIVFPHTYRGTDKDNKYLRYEIVQEELPGVLNFAIEGLKRLLKNDKFSNSKGAEKVKELYIKLSDPMRVFFSDCVIETVSDYVEKDNLYTAYKEYCKQQKITPVVTKEYFSRKIGSYLKVEPFRPHVDGKRVNAWMGVSLKNCESCSKKSICLTGGQGQEAPVRVISDKNDEIKISGGAGQGGQGNFSPNAYEGKEIIINNKLIEKKPDHPDQLSIIAIPEKKSFQKIDMPNRWSGYADTIPEKADHVTELSTVTEFNILPDFHVTNYEDFDKVGKDFIERFGPINTNTINQFTMYFKEHSSSLLEPSEIKIIAMKIFKITPEP